MTAFVLGVPDDETAAGVAEALGEDADGVEFVVWDMKDEAPRGDIDLQVLGYLGALKRLDRLEGAGIPVVQAQSIGFDGMIEKLPAGTTLCNAAGVHEASTAELTLTLILASLRGIPEFVRGQQEERWLQGFRPALADKNVLILGYGGVGKAIEDRLLPFETTVTRVASRARTDERGTVHGIDELPVLLPAADVVVVVVPLLESTRGLVDSDFIGRMKPGSLLVNMARGPVVVTDDLVEALRAGTITAAVDVTDPEPLPAGHPLWSAPGILISPHVGGATSAMRPRVLRLIADQVRALRAGDAPLNVVHQG